MLTPGQHRTAKYFSTEFRKRGQHFRRNLFRGFNGYVCFCFVHFRSLPISTNVPWINLMKRQGAESTHIGRAQTTPTRVRKLQSSEVVRNGSRRISRQLLTMAQKSKSYRYRNKSNHNPGAPVPVASVVDVGLDETASESRFRNHIVPKIGESAYNSNPQ